MIVVYAVTCAVAVALPGSPAVAGAPEAEPKPGKKLCTITDRRLAEVSGLVATEQGYLAVPDGTSSGQALQVFELNHRCRVSQRHSFPRDPFDPEDMAVSRDGTLWIADTGDNDLERDTVALWEISADRSKAGLHRLKYPDAKRDAEAMLIQPDGLPVIITKDLDGGGVAQIFVPTGPLQSKQTVPLKKVGELKYAFTGTGGGPVGGLGQRLVTGAALSADGSRAVVPTPTPTNTRSPAATWWPRSPRAGPSARRCLANRRARRSPTALTASPSSPRVRPAGPVTHRGCTGTSPGRCPPPRTRARTGAHRPDGSMACVCRTSR
jgi:hypothetical protein